MKYKHLKYDIHAGVFKVKTKVAIAMMALVLTAGGTGLSLALFGTAHAISPPTWEITAPSAITFVCGGSDYAHMLNTVSENSATGVFTGTGTYNLDNSYTWNISGNTTGSNITFTLVYTGSNSGYTLHGNGTIAPDGSISGTVDNNCQTFSMPAGTAIIYCMPTGFYRDGINMTAVVIDPSSPVTGEVNATGCNIGVYFDPGTHGTVNNANIHGSNYFGVVVRGANVDVRNSNVHNIGETPLNGDQHGVAIYYATLTVGTPTIGSTSGTNGSCTTGSTKGTIAGNTVYNYQKGGIVANCAGTDVSITNNNVNGQGPVSYIAQNGIQIGFGATGEITSNKVTGNAYTGTNFASSGGILLYGGCGDPLVTKVDINGNKLVNNDVGIYMVNYDSSCTSPAATPTKDTAVDNWISNSAVTNISGLCGGDSNPLDIPQYADFLACGGEYIGYQAGINDVGNMDFACDNNISGVGYAKQGKYNYVPTPPVFMQAGPNVAFVRHIDAGDTFPTTDFSTCHNDHFFNEHYNNQFFKFYHDRFSHWYFH